MNFQTLQYFSDIADCRSVTSAAELNHVTQQSMSGQLKKLEREYGVPLFRRTTPLQLTEAGELVLAEVRELLALHRRTLEQVRNLEESALQLGLAFSEMPPFLAEVLRRYERQAGAAERISLISDCYNTAEVPPDAIFATECPLQGYEAVPLLRDRLVAAVMPELMDRVYGVRRSRIEEEVRATGALSVLKELPFTGLRIPGHEPLLREVGESPVQTDNGRFALSLCLSGQAAVLTLEHYLHHTAGEKSGLLTFPLRETQTGPTLFLYIRRERREAAPIKALLRASREYFGENA